MKATEAVLAAQAVLLVAQLALTRRERRRQRAARGEVMRDRAKNLAILSDAQDMLAQAREFIPDIRSDLEPDDPR